MVASSQIYAYKANSFLAEHLIPHKDIDKIAWVSPGHRTHNQINHIVPMKYDGCLSVQQAADCNNMRETYRIAMRLT